MIPLKSLEEGEYWPKEEEGELWVEMLFILEVSIVFWSYYFCACVF